MRDYIDMTGKTEEEAIEKALQQLGLDRDEVSVEILERAKSGFLGIGRADAKVRIRYGEEKPDPVARAVSQETSAAPANGETDSATPGEDRTAGESEAGVSGPESRKSRRGGRGKAGETNHAPKPEGSAEADSQKARKNAPKAEDTQKTDAPKARKAGKAQKNAEGRKAGSVQKADAAGSAQKTDAAGSTQTQKAAQKKKQNAPKAEVTDAEKAAPSGSAKVARSEEGKASPDGGTAENPAAQTPASFSAPLPEQEADDEKTQAIKAFLGGLLEHMEQPAEIRVYLTEEGRYKVILEGQGMGALIGRRGETLDAIQQLTNYAVNRNGNRVRIQLDAEGYREKREQSLRNLARKEAAKVVKFRRSRTLEPMNAYERHVIHTALQDFRGVTTYSTGVDPNRRVVVAYDREKL